MHLQKQIRTVMTQRGLGRAEFARQLGYNNINKGMRRLDAWMAGQELPQGHQHTLLAELLGLSPAELNQVLEQDQQQFRSARRKERARDPHYYLTVRLIPAFYQSQQLPAGITRKEAIAIARQRAIEWQKLCALNTPNNQTLWFNLKGCVYAISEKGPSMRIGGHEVTANLLSS